MASLSFWYPLLQLIQPGILWPEIASFYPMHILNALVALACLTKLRGRQCGILFKHPAFYWMIIFVLVVRGLSVLPSGMMAILSELEFWLPIPLFVAFSLLLITSPEELRRFIWGMMLGGTFIVGYGIYSFHTGMRDVIWLGLAGAYGMYANHNDYTFMIIQVFPFLYTCRRAGTGFLRNSLLYAGMSACVYGVIISRSRGGIIALMLEFVLVILLTKTRRQQVVLFPLLIVVGTAGVIYQFNQRASMAKPGGYTEEKAESSRFELWKAGKNMFLAHPLLGVGSQRFQEYAKDYYELSHDQLGKVAHNTYIQVAATTGIFGVIGFGAMLFAVRRELTVKLTDERLASLDWIRVAAIIYFNTLLFRALLASKDYDWGFYFLVVIAVVLHSLKCSIRSPIVTGRNLVSGSG